MAHGEKISDVSTKQEPWSFNSSKSVMGLVVEIMQQALRSTQDFSKILIVY